MGTCNEENCKSPTIDGHDVCQYHYNKWQKDRKYRYDQVNKIALRVVPIVLMSLAQIFIAMKVGTSKDKDT